MRTLIVVTLFVGACGAGKLAADQSTVRAKASQELSCSTEPKLVYYGLRGKDIAASSACFGQTADALAVVECGDRRKAYWRNAGNWEARPGEVTAVHPDHVEITLPEGAENASGSVSAVARCGH